MKLDLAGSDSAANSIAYNSRAMLSLGRKQKFQNQISDYKPKPFTITADQNPLVNLIEME